MSFRKQVGFETSAELHTGICLEEALNQTGFFHVFFSSTWESVGMAVMMNEGIVQEHNREPS